MTQSSNSSSWTSTQAYVLAIICLVVGVAVGYFVRGSASPAAAAPVEQASASQAPAGMGGMDPSKITPEQLKHMVEKQVEPIQQQLKANPNDPALLAQVGNVYYDTQLYQDAIGYYEKSLNADPKNVGVRTDMGTAYFYLGDADRAIAEFNKALSEDPKHGQTLYNLGMVQWQGKGDVTAAVAAWEKLLKTVPDYPERAKVEQLVAKAKEHSKMTPGQKTSKPATM